MPEDSLLKALFIPTHGSEEELAQAAYLASLADPTPHGRLLAKIALQKIGPVPVPMNSQLVYSTGEQELCGINLDDQMIRQGSIDSIEEWLRTAGGYLHIQLRRTVGQILSRGGLAIVVANESIDLGVVCLVPIQA